MGKDTDSIIKNKIKDIKIMEIGSNNFMKIFNLLLNEFLL